MSTFLEVVDTLELGGNNDWANKRAGVRKVTKEGADYYEAHVQFGTLIDADVVLVTARGQSELEACDNVLRKISNFSEAVSFNISDELTPIRRRATKEAAVALVMGTQIPVPKNQDN